MSTEIDSKVVEMKFNNKDFEQNAKTSMSTLDKLKSKLNFGSEEKSLDSFGQKASSFKMDGMGSAIDGIKVKFSALEVAGIAALTNLTNKAVDAGVQLYKSLSTDNIAAGWEKFSEKTTSVSTLVAQGYDLDVVNEQLEKLNWFTDETSYNFTDMVSNISKFTASGKSLEDSVTAMEGIANWAALSGQNATTASRAMYQISQAMSAGYMRLEDYTSIQNASMDTQEFRQKTLAAAESLGTLKKVSDGVWYSTIDGEEVTLDNFTSTLTEGMWLTSDVMMKVFNQYSSAVDDLYEYTEKNGVTASEAIEEMGDSLDSFGLKAFKAAQQARTWTDVVDSVKDAVSTGWMNTFEIVIGDQEQAVKLFTTLANEMYDIFAAGGEARNEFLSAVLGADSKAFGQLTGRELLLKSLGNVMKSILSIIDAVKEGFREIFPPLTAEKAYGILEAFYKLTETLKPSEKTIETVKNAFKGLFSIFSMGKQIVGFLFDALKELFNLIPGGSSAFSDIITKVSNFFIEMDKGLKESEWFEKALTEIKEIVSSLSETFKKASEDVKYFFTDIFSGSSQIGGPFVDGIVNGIKDSVPKIKEAVISVANALLQGIKDLLGIHSPSVRGQEIGMYFDQGVEKGLNDNKATIISTVKEIGSEVVTSFWDSIKEKFSVIINAISGAVKWIYNFIKPALDALGSTLKNVFMYLSDRNFEPLLNIVKSGFFAVLATNINGILSNSKKTVEAVKEVFEGFSEVINNFALSIKADALGKIAKAILELAAGILILSLIDKSALTRALLSITALFTELMVVFKIMNKTIGSGNGADKLANANSMKKMASMLVEISAAVLILSFALSNLAKIDQDKMGQGLLSLAAILIELLAFMKIADGEKFASGGVNVVLVATAILVLYKAIDKLGQLDLGVLAKGIVSIGLLLTMIGLLTKEMAENKITLGTRTSILVIETLLWSIAGVVAIIGNLSIPTLAKAIVSLGVGLAGIVLAVNSMNGSLSGAASILVVANALLILAPALLLLSTLSLSGLGIALLAIAGAIGVLALSAALLSPVVPVMRALAASIALLSTGLLIGSVALSVFVIALSTLGTIGSVAIGVFMSVATAAAKLIPIYAEALADGFVAFVKSIQKQLDTLFDAVYEVCVKLLDVLDKLIPKLADVLVRLLIEVMACIEKYLPDFLDLGFKIVVAVINGTTKALPEFVSAIVDFIDTALETISKELPRIVKSLFNYYKDLISNVADVIENSIPELMQAFSKIGSSIFKGIVKGIKLQFGTIKDIGKWIADLLTGGTEEELDINSPSKKGQEIGKYYDLGIAKGVKDSTSTVIQSAKDLGKKMADDLGDIIKSVELPTEDLSPVIKPVLDLTNIQNGSSTIGKLLNLDSFSLDSSVSSISGTASSFDSATGSVISTGSSINFTQNNYSPKALDRLEIYRQTKNELSTIKGVVGNT